MPIDNKLVVNAVKKITNMTWSTNKSQDLLSAQVVAAYEDKIDYTMDNLNSGFSREVDRISNAYKAVLNSSVQIAGSAEAPVLFKDSTPTNVGYPIKFQKTHILFDILQQFLRETDDCTKPYGQNAVNRHDVTLPELGKPSAESPWGNECPSVNTVKDSLLLQYLGGPAPMTQKITGAATYYPFYNPNASLDSDVVANYPLVNENGFLLFGSYQFGGHRYFESPKAFGPEDCSSFVAKVYGFDVKTLNTVVLRSVKPIAEGSENTNPYGLNVVGTIDPNTTELNLNDIISKIQPGDIYVRLGHTAVISEVKGQVAHTLQFNRDLEGARMEGCGSYNYNLGQMHQVLIGPDEVDGKEVVKVPVSILRPQDAEKQILHESINMNDFVRNYLDKLDQHIDCQNGVPNLTDEQLVETLGHDTGYDNIDS